MRWICGALLLVVAGIVVAGIAHAESNGVEWRDDLAAARKEAARTGKPLLVVFRCVP